MIASLRRPVSAAIWKRMLPKNAKCFSSSTSFLQDDDDYTTAPAEHHPPITVFTEDEQMTRDAVRQWARDELSPVVRDMDEKGQLRPEIIQSLFDQGFMGMEIEARHGGSELNFTSACLAVEEIARVDPSTAILVDIHNTLTNNAVRFWGSKELQETWLPRLATDTPSSFCLSEAGSGSDAFSMKTTATLSSDGSYYTLQGSKLWIRCVHWFCFCFLGHDLFEAHIMDVINSVMLLKQAFF